MLAIAAGKKTLVAHRTEERERKQRTRANQKAALVANSGTVPENSEPAPEPPDTPTGDDEGTCTAQEQTPEPEFTTPCGRLLQKIDKQKPDRFAATGIPSDKLAKLGKFLTDLARQLGAKPTAVFVPQGNGTVSAGQSGEDRKAWHAANEASGEEAEAVPVAAKSKMHSLNTGEI